MPSIKTVAIAPTRRGSQRKPPAPLSVEVDELAEAPSGRAAIPLQPRRIQAQPHHRYRVGERLRMGSGGYTVARVAAFCKVIALLPYEGHGALLYRVRSDNEQFERIVAEADLSRNSVDP